MKICQIGQHEFPAGAAAAGIDAHVKSVSLRLARRGHTVTVYTYPPRPQTGPSLLTHGPHVDIRPLPSLRGKSTGPLLHALLCSAASAVGPAEIVHYHGPGPALFSWIPRLAGKKVLTSFHGLDWKRRKWGPAGRVALRLAEACAVRFSHRIACDSNEVRVHCRERYGTDAEVIPNGAETVPHRPPQIIRERWGLDRDRFILFLGRFVPEKRVEWLVRSYADLAAEGSGVVARQRLVLAGCSDHTPHYERRLRELADRLAPGRVTFAGRISERAAAELYANASLFVLPSDVEGCPIALLEAMSAGCPCLASDIPPHLEILSEGKTGWFFRSADRESLAEKMGLVLASPSRRAVGRRASVAALTTWTWERTTRRTLRLYRALLGGTST